MADSEELKILIRDAVTREYEKLKNESKNYGELCAKCKAYCTELGFSEKELGMYARKTFGKLMIHEIRRIEIDCE